MKAELTEMDSVPDHLEDSEDEGNDESVPIHIIKERTTKSYKEAMSQDIENIDIYDTKKTLI